MDGRHREERGLKHSQVASELREPRQIAVLKDAVPLDEVGDDKNRDWADDGELDGRFGEQWEKTVDVVEGDGGVGIRDHEGLPADIWTGRRRGVFDEALLVQ